MAVRMEQLVNNDNEHVAPLSHLCPPLIRDSEYSHDERARSHIAGDAKVIHRVQSARNNYRVIMDKKRDMLHKHSCQK